jgi:hypothetical protein
MPKPGFKSITVSENVYKKFFKVYERNKKKTRDQGHKKLLWIPYKYDGGDDAAI